MARLEHVIARNLVELRTEKEATQYDVAERMRIAGFGWQTNRVTQIETLRRPVSIIEVVGLARVFNVTVTRLLAGDAGEPIDLPGGGTMPLGSVRIHLTEEDPEPPPELSEKDRERSTMAREDLKRMASRLGVDPSTLQELSERMWGHSFWVERAQRVGDVSGLTKRSAQTKRGHATRGMVADIREWMANN